MTSGSATNPPGTPRCSGRNPSGTSVDGSTGSRDASASSARCVVSRAVGVHAVPHGKRHAEKPLTADAPVAVEAVHPVLIAREHVRGHPLQFAAEAQELIANVHRADEPLPARDDFERAVALFEELDVVRDRPDVADQIARLPEQFDDPGARLGSREARERIVGRLRARLVPGRPAWCAPTDGLQRAVLFQDRAHGKIEFAPPDHVRQIAERADHRNARSLFGIGKRVGPHRHGHLEDRRQHLAADERRIPLVIRVRHERDAGGNQLRARRVDLRLSAPPSASANVMR